MKVSIVNAILDSPEIARRQVLHYNRIELPNDVEVIFIDDGSRPALDLSTVSKFFNFRQYATNNFRPWTQPAARNLGAEKAAGEYCIFTDIDHILTAQAIETARTATADVIRFKRQVAILRKDGSFSQDRAELKEWGFDRKSVKIAPHGNSYIFRRDLYLRLGGVDTRFVGTGRYPNREEVPLKRKLKTINVDIIDDDRRPTIYMFPNGKYAGSKDANPFGLFHKLSRMTNREKRNARLEHNHTSA
jgi:glycosyltransferase involved in cell wall biosynthesis